MNAQVPALIAGACDAKFAAVFRYVMNAMAGSSWQSPRAKALLEAVYASL